jgi:hypothetical protein
MLPVFGYDNHDNAQVKHVPCVCQRQALEIVHVLFSIEARRYDAGDMLHTAYDAGDMYTCSIYSIIYL